MAASPRQSEACWLAGSCAAPEVEELGGFFLSSDKHQVLILGRSRPYSGAAFRAERPVMGVEVSGEGRGVKTRSSNAKTKTKLAPGSVAITRKRVHTLTHRERRSNEKQRRRYRRHRRSLSTATGLLQYWASVAEAQPKHYFSDHYGALVAALERCTRVASGVRQVT